MQSHFHRLVTARVLISTQNYEPHRKSARCCLFRNSNFGTLKFAWRSSAEPRRTRFHGVSLSHELITYCHLKEYFPLKKYRSYDIKIRLWSCFTIDILPHARRSIVSTTDNDNGKQKILEEIFPARTKLIRSFFFFIMLFAILMLRIISFTRKCETKNVLVRSSTCLQRFYKRFVCNAFQLSC